METTPLRCLILACGNPLRGDDGVGPHLAAWAEERFVGTPGLRIISRQQWTPELAADLAKAEAAIFIDCSVAMPPGTTILAQVAPARKTDAPATHQLDATELLELTNELYASLPRSALLLTIGAGSVELHEGFSEAVAAALPAAQTLLEETVLRLLGKTQPV
jgi:hydrogenase maturation protease